MKTISRYIMTLALLITAVTGAWAQEETLLTTINASSDFTSGSKTFEDAVTATFSGEVAYANEGWYNPYSTGRQLTVEANDGYTVTRVKFFTTLGDAEDTTAPFEAGMKIAYVYVDGESAGRYQVLVNGNRIGAETSYNYLTKIEVYGYQNATPIEVTLDDAKKVATMEMPASDVTVTYELVRDLAQQVTFSGVPTGDGLVVKNNGTAYEFVTAPTFTLTDALADNADIISAEGITLTVGKMVEVEGFEGYRQFDEATAVSLADFLANPQPGTYKMKATATADGPYDGTVYSAEFTTVEKYDLAIQPADDYSKGKLSEVTVAGAAQTLDADGKATTTADPGAEVKLKAKTGYVIEKVEAKKIVPAEGHDLTASAVGDIVGSDGKTYAAADKDNLPKNVTAVAMVAYKNGTGGLAIALSDEGSMNFSTAKSTCESKTAISGATWLLPSKNQWEQIFSANGGNNNSCTGLNTAIDNAGGTALVAGNVYWTTSSAIVSGSHYCLIINTGGSITSQIGSSGNNKMTRAILTF